MFRPCLWIALQVPWFWWEQGPCRLSLNQCVSLGKHWLLKKTQEGTLNAGVGKCNRSNSSLLSVGLTNSLVQCTHMTHGFPMPTAYFPLSSFRLSLDNTEAELHSLFVRTRSLQENIQRDGELCQQMQDFLQVCGWLSSDLLISSSSQICMGVFAEAASSHSYSPCRVSKRNFIFQGPFFAGWVFQQRTLGAGPLFIPAHFAWLHQHQTELGSAYAAYPPLATYAWPLKV